jgi:hypothetical protein
MPTVTAKNIKNEKVSFEIDLSSKVSECKKKISELIDIPTNMKLIYLGHVLNDDKTLESYNVKDGSAIIYMPAIAPSKPITFDHVAPVTTTMMVPTAQEPEVVPPMPLMPALPANMNFLNNPQGAMFMLGILQAMAADPQMLQIQQADPAGFQQLLANPNFLQQVMQMGQHQQQHQMASYDNPEGDEDGEHDEHDGHVGALNHVPITTTIQFTKEEFDEIKELESISGVSQSEVIQMYMACGKDKELALNNLLQE